MTAVRSILFISLLYILFSQSARAQIIVTGTVYDSSKLYTISGVTVKSTSGNVTYTDSLGSYSLNVKESDSISFSYMNKPTMKFPVSLISNYTQFDISLRVQLYQKYRPLKEIFIFSRRKQDSTENRQQYSNIFNFRKPGIKSSYTPGSPPGFDIDELIGIFQFRKNKRTLNFQKRLIEQEQESYINYRFSSSMIKRITNLKDEELKKYKLQYRPTYAFAVASNDLEFYDYVLKTSYLFRSRNGLPPMSTE